MVHDITLGIIFLKSGVGMAQWLGSLTTDPRVFCLSPGHDEMVIQSEDSRQPSVIPGVGITRCGHNEKKDQDTTR